ncbi:MAG: hypothetical protein EBY92_04710 [Actinobacteria bacterium]|nr:hypothetical protein [Actinomycetota bacterium]
MREVIFGCGFGQLRTQAGTSAGDSTRDDADCADHADATDECGLQGGANCEHRPDGKHDSGKHDERDGARVLGDRKHDA